MAAAESGGFVNGRLPPIDRSSLDDVAQAYHDMLVASPRGGRVVDPDGTLRGPFEPWMHRPDLGIHLAALGEALRFNGTLGIVIAN